MARCDTRTDSRLPASGRIEKDTPISAEQNKK
jgi:hypothetical protein